MKYIYIYIPSSPSIPLFYSIQDPGSELFYRMYGTNMKCWAKSWSFWLFPVFMCILLKVKLDCWVRYIEKKTLVSNLRIFIACSCTFAYLSEALLSLRM